MPTEVIPDLPARIRAAAAAVTDRKAAYVLALQQRNLLIEQAVDEGMQQQAVADLAGVRKGRISAILAGSQPDVAE